MLRKAQSDGDLPAKVDPSSSTTDLQSPSAGSLLKGGSGSSRGSVLSLFERTPSQTGLGKVTKSHWKLDSDSPECYNLSCRKGFNFFERKHHCRKCGNIFCSECTNFEIKLGPDAEYHPQGISCKVCNNCFNDHLAVLKRQQGSPAVHEAVARIKGQNNRHSLSAEDLRDVETPKRPRESSEETLVGDDAKSKFLAGVDQEEYLTRRRRTQEFLEKRLARRPSVDEVADRLKNWDWSTF